MTKRLIQCLGLSAVFTALFACSSDTGNIPTELSRIENPISVDKAWDADAGSGDDELQLQLEPFVSGPSVFTIDIDGELQSRSTETGRLEWEVDLDRRVSGGVSGDSRQLYVNTFQGQLIALSRSNGQELWQARLSSEALSVVASDGSTVVVHASDGKVFGINADTGAQRWRYDSDTPVLSLRGTSSPLISGDSVYVGLANGALIGIAIDSGRQQWSVNLGTPSGRTELERLVDVDGTFVLSGRTLYATAYQGDLKAISLTTGETLWSMALSSYSGVGVSKDGNTIISADSDGRVFAVEASTGKELWETEKLLYRRLGAVTTILNYGVVADFEGYVHFLDLSNGDLVGRVRPDSDGVLGRIKVVESTLYVYTRSGNLYTYELNL
ncbi:outer membrane protein assembly factor BamB [Oleiphilus sp. HI0125]|uniref:outer membrane protein assembly factor BamB n=2 Tax=Oleiphilus sp. HI0125 TaxID=1822266 RepID=UPI000AC3930D|nr:outer membrane protein assembly factor BamB [Oleiphilus sp. HI0125]